MRDQGESLLAQKFDDHGAMLFRICMVLLGNQQDTEGAAQDTFVGYWKTRPDFQSAEREKVWLIRVTTNKSKDRLRSQFHRSTTEMEALEGIAEYPNDLSVLEQLATPPYKGKTILYLHYVEGYRLREIGDLLGMKENVVKVVARRGREKLKLQIKEASAE